MLIQLFFTVLLLEVVLIHYTAIGKDGVFHIFGSVLGGRQRPGHRLSERVLRKWCFLNDTLIEGLLNRATNDQKSSVHTQDEKKTHVAFGRTIPQKEQALSYKVWGRKQEEDSLCWRRLKKCTREGDQRE